MIRALVKLAIAGLIANACWRVGSEYVAHFKFKDAVREAAAYEGGSDRQLQQRILAIGAAFDRPLDEDSFAIQRSDRHLVISGEYVRPIEILPGYPYAWHFAWSVEADARVAAPIRR